MKALNLIQTLAFYLFLAVISVLGGIVLPILLFVGASYLWHRDWLVGLLLVELSIGAYALAQVAYSSRHHIFRRSTKDEE